MAGGNVSPRQKMINMMYLVLTALLALQVSSEVLAAFFRINNSLSSSNVNTVSKIDALYQDNISQKIFNPIKKSLLNLLVPSYTETTNHVTV